MLCFASVLLTVWFHVDKPLVYFHCEFNATSVHMCEYKCRCGFVVQGQPSWSLILVPVIM